MSEPEEAPKPTTATRPFTAWLRRTRTIRDVPTYAEGLVFGTACIGFVLLLWWALTVGEGDARIVDVYSLPSPADTLASFHILWFDRELSLSIVTSLGRVLGGFLAAAAVGVPLGVIAGSYLRVNAFLKPLTIFGRNVPIAALIPLTVLWLGIGEFQKVMFIFLASVAFVFFDTTTSAQNVPDRFIDTAYTLGARDSRKKGARLAALAGLVYGAAIMLGWYWMLEDKTRTLTAELASTGCWLRFAGGFVVGFALWFPIFGHQVMRKVILPLALPDIVNSLRLIYGLAFGYIMLAEVINARSGLGALIIVSQRQGPREHIYLCLMIIALLAWGIDRGIMALQRHLFPHLRNAQA